MTQLYVLREEYEKALASAVDASTGEIVDAALGEHLDKIEGELTQKCLDLAALVVNLEAEARAYNARAEQLAEFCVAAENRARSLKAYLAMHVAPGFKLSDDRVKISWRKSTRTVLRVLLDALPEKWVRVTTTRAPDLASLSEALRSGDEEASKYAALEIHHNLQVK